MSSHRIYNFNAGPAALPLPVLEEIQAGFLDFGGSGMSVTEVSHRSKWFDDVINDTVDRFRRLLQLDDRYHVLFLQGGASMQFCMVPMNVLPDGASADYVDTGTWSTKAIKEARTLGKTVNVAASSEDKNYSYIPRELALDPKAAYVHITSNNTIKGTQWHCYPDTAGVPLVADMSSDIMSRPLDPGPFGLIYAGAQKNIGPAGLTVVIVREDLIGQPVDGQPVNTPPEMLFRMSVAGIGAKVTATYARDGDEAQTTVALIAAPAITRSGSWCAHAKACGPPAVWFVCEIFFRPLLAMVSTSSRRPM